MFLTFLLIPFFELSAFNPAQAGFDWNFKLQQQDDNAFSWALDTYNSRFMDDDGLPSDSKYSGSKNIR